MEAGNISNFFTDNTPSLSIFVNYLLHKKVPSSILNYVVCKNIDKTLWKVSTYIKKNSKVLSEGKYAIHRMPVSLNVISQLSKISSRSSHKSWKLTTCPVYALGGTENRHVQRSIHDDIILNSLKQHKMRNPCAELLLVWMV